jgi:hypothetical protein
MDALEKVMNVIKHGGFINYYGILRCSTLAATPELTNLRDAKIWNSLDPNPPDWPGITSVRLA